VKFALCLLGTIVSASPAAQAQERFEYQRTLHGDLLGIEAPTGKGVEGRMTYASDEVRQATFCQQDSKYVCIFSNRYALAVPRNLGRAGRTWTVNGATFEIIADGMSVSLFGRRRDGLYLISTPVGAVGGEAKQSIMTLYHPQYGAIGFSVRFKSGDESTYWSTSEIGWGAIKK
jgi:hypothetical protein